MSADNGVYILETLKKDKPNTFEFRVAHLQAVENVDWDQKQKCETEDDQIRIKNARKMWKNCKIFTSKKDALTFASDVLDELMICEYGISFVTINEVF